MYLVIDTESGGPSIEYSLLELCILKFDSLEGDLVPTDKLLLKTAPDDKVFKVSQGGLRVCNVDLRTFEPDCTYNQLRGILYNKLSDWGCKPKSTIVIGKGVMADLRMIWHYGLSQKSWRGFVSAMPIDIDTLYQVLRAYGHIPEYNSGSIEELMEFFYPGNSFEYHTAMSDALCTALIAKKMMEEFCGKKEKETREKV